MKMRTAGRKCENLLSITTTTMKTIGIEGIPFNSQCRINRMSKINIYKLLRLALFALSGLIQSNKTFSQIRTVVGDVWLAEMVNLVDSRTGSGCSQCQSLRLYID